MSRCRRLGFDQRHSIHFKEEHKIADLLLFAKRKSQFSDITILEKSIEGLNSPLVKAQTAAGKYLRRQKKRAAAVKAKLLGMGIAANRLTTDGKGEKEPVAGNDTEAGKATNRRVQFIKL